jgi:phenylalanyl-tRNA synthetase beta chain
MRLPYRWLQDFVKLDATPEQVCDHLIMLGFSDAEVIPDEWDCLDDFVVGRATKIDEISGEPHLKVVEVNVGYTSLVSVCGAPNVKVGTMYAVALPGAKMGSGQTVDSATISGVNSECVLCSGWEAWLDDSKDELLELDSEIVPGSKLVRVLGLDEPVIEVEVTPNRGDCLGLIGIARELAAVFGRELMIPEPALSENGSDIDDVASVEVVDNEGCPRYGAIVLEDVEVRGSRAEVRARLRLAGLRPINNVVDATNMVLYETGHPLHAFDLDELAGSKIIVRRAMAGEMIAAIDGNKYELREEDLVIADSHKPVALAGIIGGQDSEVTAKTRRVLVEGAFFDRSFIWRTSKRLGITSEAAFRFARTVDVGAVLYVLARTAAIIQKDMKCKASRGMIDVHPDPVPPAHVFVNPKRLNKLLGTSIPEQEICDYLERLGFLVSPGKELEVIVPTRRRDVESEADIAEEVARLYGYDRIAETTTRSCQSYGKLPLEARVVNRARATLTGMGLSEAVTDAMVDPKSLDPFGLSPDSVVEVRNPVGVQNSVLRSSLIPGMTSVLVMNERRGQDEVAMFELGNVYFKDGSAFGETRRLAIGLSGLKQQRAWYAKPRGSDFYDLKGILESLAEVMGVELVFAEGVLDCLHPGRRASVSLKSEGGLLQIGHIGEIAGPVCEAVGSRRRLYVAEIDFDCLIPPASRLRRYEDLGRYPSVKRDLALILPEDVLDSQVRDAILSEGGSLIESVEIFDIYEGEQIPEGTKSLAYGIVFRSPSRTLTEDEIDGLQKRIEDHLANELNARIRMK